MFTLFVIGGRLTILYIPNLFVGLALLFAYDTSYTEPTAMYSQPTYTAYTAEFQCTPYTLYISGIPYIVCIRQGQPQFLFKAICIGSKCSQKSVIWLWCSICNSYYVLNRWCYPVVRVLNEGCYRWFFTGFTCKMISKSISNCYTVVNLQDQRIPKRFDWNLKAKALVIALLLRTLSNLVWFGHQLPFLSRKVVLLWPCLGRGCLHRGIYSVAKSAVAVTYVWLFGDGYWLWNNEYVRKVPRRVCPDNVLNSDMSRCTRLHNAGKHDVSDDFWATDPCSSTKLRSYKPEFTIYRTLFVHPTSLV